MIFNQPKCSYKMSYQSVIQKYFEMKISLNQPGGFASHFAPDKNKYLNSDAKIQHKKSEFNPYVNHQGSVAAVAGEDFVVVIGDTRLSEGYNIVHRNSSKLFQLTDKTIIATSGMLADFAQLKRVLVTKLQAYQYRIQRKPSTLSIANLVSKTLYGRRFFPYYTFNLVAGLDDEGKGVVYGYDAIGSYGPDRALSQGSGGHMLLPYLDSQFVAYNNPDPNKKTKFSKQETIEILYKAFVAAAQRDIYTGDKVQIVAIDKNGTTRQERPLRKD